MYRRFFENIVFLYVEKHTQRDICRKCHSVVVINRNFSANFILTDCDIRLCDNSLSSCVKHFKYILYICIRTYTRTHVLARLCMHVYVRAGDRAKVTQYVRMSNMIF